MERFAIRRWCGYWLALAAPLFTSIVVAQDLGEIAQSSRALAGAIDGIPSQPVRVVSQYIPGHGLHFSVVESELAMFSTLEVSDFAPVVETLQALAPTVRGLLPSDVITIAVLERLDGAGFQLVFRYVDGVVEAYLDAAPFAF